MGRAGDLFGYSVALEGHVSLVGARGYDGAWVDSGSAYVFGGLIFADGFESGDAAAWSLVVP